MRLMLAALALLAVAPEARAGDCAAPLTDSQLAAKLSSVDAAFAEGDPDAFMSGVQSIGLSLECLDAVPAATDIAHLHRIYGLVKFIENDEPGAKAAARASRRVDPGAELSLDVVPDGHPYRVMWETAQDDGERVRVGEAEQGTVWFDGADQPQRPATSATLFQYEEDGRIVTSRWLLPGDALPEYAAKPLPLPSEGLSRRDVALGAASGGTAAAALGMFVGAVVTRRSFDSQVTAREDGTTSLNQGASRDEVVRLQSLNNRLMVGATGAGVVALGLGVAVVAF